MIRMDLYGKQAGEKQGDISLAGLGPGEAGPVHSSTLLEEIQKSQAFTRPVAQATETAYGFDDGDDEETGVQPLSDEDVARQ